MCTNEKLSGLLSRSSLNEFFLIKLIHIFNDNVLNISAIFLILILLKSVYCLKSKVFFIRKILLYLLIGIFLLIRLNEISSGEEIITIFNAALTNNLVVIHPFLTQLTYAFIIVIIIYYKKLIEWVLLTKPILLVFYSRLLLLL